MAYEIGKTFLSTIWRKTDLHIQCLWFQIASDPADECSSRLVRCSGRIRRCSRFARIQQLLGARQDCTEHEWAAGTGHCGIAQATQVSRKIFGTLEKRYQMCKWWSRNRTSCSLDSNYFRNRTYELVKLFQRRKYKFFQIPGLIILISRLAKSVFLYFRGQTPAEAENHYLETCRELSMYGIFLFPAKVRKWLSMQK